MAKTNPPLERAGKTVLSGSPFFGSFFGEAKTELVRRAKPPFKIIIRAADSTTTPQARAHAAKEKTTKPDTQNFKVRRHLYAKRIIHSLTDSGFTAAITPKVLMKHVEKQPRSY